MALPHSNWTAAVSGEVLRGRVENDLPFDTVRLRARFVPSAPVSVSFTNRPARVTPANGDETGSLACSIA